MLSFTLAALTIGIASPLAFAQNNDFEKVIENGKTVYKKKANKAGSKQRKNQKVKVDMYLSLGCKKCVPAIMTILDHDTTFLRKNIDQKTQFKKELIKLTGNTKTPIIFIDGKEIQSLSPAVIEFELRKAGARRKPPSDYKESEIDESKIKKTG